MYTFRPIITFPTIRKTNLGIKIMRDISFKNSGPHYFLTFEDEIINGLRHFLHFLDPTFTTQSLHIHIMNYGPLSYCYHWVCCRSVLFLFCFVLFVQLQVYITVLYLLFCLLLCLFCLLGCIGRMEGMRNKLSVLWSDCMFTCQLKKKNTISRVTYSLIILESRQLVSPKLCILYQNNLYG